MAKKKKKAARKRTAPKRKTAVKKRRANPPKMRRLAKSTGWMSATAVKIVKRRGKPDEVLIRKPAGKKARKSKKRR